MRKGFFRGALLLLVAIAGAPPARAGSAIHPFREGEVIVKFRDEAVRSMADMDSAYQRNHVIEVKRFHGALRNFEHLTFAAGGRSVDSVIADLQRDSAVEYVQPNFLLFAHELAPDPAAASLPGKGARPGVLPRPADAAAAPDPLLGHDWGLTKIGATQAWRRSPGSRSVVVAVVDTGIDYNHPDLAANIWRNPNYGRGEATGVDAEGTTGITGDLVGWDFVHNDNLPYDDAGHGTHVSGTIGAVGANGVGISGVSPRVSLMAVKFLGADGSGDTASAIRGIDYAIARGAKVLNNSWGGKGGVNTALRDAIQRVAAAGALFVASAGNDGSDNDVDPSYPASLALPSMITVAATDEYDRLALFSNTGHSVDIGAPGVDIYSTLPGAKYGMMSGTSMAAPHVTGAAALVWAAHPAWTAAQVKARLLETGDLLPALQGKTASGRRLNVNRAL